MTLTILWLKLDIAWRWLNRVTSFQHTSKGESLLLLTYSLFSWLIQYQSIMPRFKSVTKLETLSLNQFCKICAITCTSLEEKADDSQQPSTLDAEGKFKSFLILLPRQILEQVITKTLTIITSEVRKKRSHKGLIKAIECLPQKSVQKLDLASLYSQVRLYGHVNTRCVF